MNPNNELYEVTKIKNEIIFFENVDMEIFEKIVPKN